MHALHGSVVLLLLSSLLFVQPLRKPLPLNQATCFMRMSSQPAVCHPWLLTQHCPPNLLKLSPRCRPLSITGVVETCQDFVNITKRDGSETQARRTGAGRAAGLPAPPLQLSALSAHHLAVQLISLP